MTASPAPRLQDKPVTCERLFEELQALRLFLLPVWAAWTASQSRSSEDDGERLDILTAVFLCKILGPGWTCTGGSPLEYDRMGEQRRVREGGFLALGVWHPHWWVQSAAWLVDLRASRFDAEPVILTRTSDPCYRATIGTGDVDVEKRGARDVVLMWQRHWMGHEAQRTLALRPR